MGAAGSTRFVSVTSIGDQFGQPLIAALYEDPNGDLNYDDNRVIFTRWDGVAKAFTTSGWSTTASRQATPGRACSVLR
jgi:hypothetical protein